MEKLLVAVDNSPYLDKILTYLVRVCANRADMEFVMLHIRQSCVTVDDLLAEDFDRDRLIQKIDELRHNKKKCDEGQRRICDRLRDKVMTGLTAAGIPSGRITMEFTDDNGDYSQIILQKAAEHGCSTIVVGKKGDSIVSEYLIGSTAEKMARRAKGFTIWLVD